MNDTPDNFAEVREILVLETDRLRGAVVARTLSRVFPHARVYSEHLTTVAAKVLADNPIDLFVVAVRGFDLDVLTLLGVWAQHAEPQTRLLVMTPDVNSAAMKAIQTLPVAAVFDCSHANLRELEFACRAVASGKPYWCPATAVALESAHKTDSIAPRLRLRKPTGPSANRMQPRPDAAG